MLMLGYVKFGLNELLHADLGHQLKVGVDAFGMFWLYFCTAGGSEDTLSISTVQSV